MTLVDRPDLSGAPVDTDISSRTFWAKPFEEREKTFAWLREHAPVSYHRPYESTLLPPDDDTPGFWALTRHDDIQRVSRDPEVFCSEKGIVMEDFPEIIQVASTSFLAMDAPEHTRMRRIVSRAFTPRRVKQITDLVEATATELIDDMLEEEQGDFSTLFAAQMPGRVFAHFFGIDPKGDQAQALIEAAEKMLAWDDPAAAGGRDALTTFAEESEVIQDIALEYADERRETPGDDMISWVVNAEGDDGDALEDWEVASYFSLLGAASNDTTRHTLANGVRLLSEWDDQRALFLSDIDGHVENVVEEVLRMSSVVQHFRRTATADCEVGGQVIKAGEKVVMWYCSGNRDEAVFPDSGRFDMQRENVKSHMAFGAGGPHFCLGSSLARSMLTTSFRELYRRLPDLRLEGAPHFQLNSFIHGIDEMPCTWARK